MIFLHVLTVLNAMDEVMEVVWEQDQVFTTEKVMAIWNWNVVGWNMLGAKDLDSGHQAAFHASLGVGQCDTDLLFAIERSRAAADSGGYPRQAKPRIAFQGQLTTSACWKCGLLAATSEGGGGGGGQHTNTAGK